MDDNRPLDDTSPTDADAALDPAAMYALLQNQQRSVETQMGAFVPIITLGWAFTWLLGFGAIWLVDGLRPAFGIPVVAAASFFAACILITGGLSAWLGIRSGRGIRGATAAAFTGTVYGITWSLGATAIAVLGVGLQHQGMSAEVANYYYPTAYVLFAGIMYVVAGAIWQAVPSLVAGVWLVVIAVVATFLPYPSHYLFLAIAASAMFFAITIVMTVRLRRARAAANAGDRRG